jgi:hypothetical protein
MNKKYLSVCPFSNFLSVPQYWSPVPVHIIGGQNWTVERKQDDELDGVARGTT